ncbi:MarR family transcriptional regulator [Bacillus coahuilensis m2-6]|uniref:HTH-type transcriptional regulator SarZ n=1 Tax=Bacillus coahuilensis p1.1.43 TaxID=1150625 RepID=A0A147K3U3_9BACI|nr:MarR family transcriptional regulator [Bacillus coahuilensis]KUP03911.1 MarR family transcriptional regulator [Bacillus coahuilensis p1.1.43]KUP04100.1 MarR family transcriptional regulator [Bacillus coahuilensis m2-6]
MSQKSSLSLDQQLCFTIYAASREMTKIYRPLLEELDLTYPQYLAMLALWEEDGLTVKKLGEKLFLDSGTLTPMLKRMEGNGLLSRKRDAEDERKVGVFLTEKGKELKSKAECIPTSILEAYNGAPVEDLLKQMKGLLHDIQEYSSK